MPTCFIICKSVHHQNTAQVARVMAKALKATVVSPEELPYTSLSDDALIGFGSGIYYGSFHPALREWVEGLPDAPRSTRRAFVFSTSGLPMLWKLWHRPFTRALARKGFRVVGEFHCRGFDRWGPLWLAGGINRGHPDARDLERAAVFARSLKDAPATLERERALR